MPTVFAHIAPTYPEVAVQQNGLGVATIDSKIGKAIVDAQAKGATVGWQYVLGNTGVAEIANGFALATVTKSSYVEVYLADCVYPNPRIQSLLLTAAGGDRRRAQRRPQDRRLEERRGAQQRQGVERRLF
jgi:hypothetical protein